MKNKAEEHWAVISPAHPEEFGKCMEEVNYINEKSNLNDSVVNAYKLAYEKKDEEGKTVLLSIFILQKI